MKQSIAISRLNWIIAGALALFALSALSRTAQAAPAARRPANSIFTPNNAIAPGTIPSLILFNAQAATDVRPLGGPVTLVGEALSIGGGGVALKVQADSGTTGYVLAQSADGILVGSRVRAVGTVGNGVLWARSVNIQVASPSAPAASEATVTGKVVAIAAYSGNLTVKADTGATGVVLAQFSVHIPVGSRVVVGGTLDRGVLFAASVSLLPVRPY